MDKVLLVFLGGGIGSVLRYLMQGWLNAPPDAKGWPWGTLAVNIAGCAVAGGLAGLGSTRLGLDEHARLLLAVGLLGGFTTFSAVSYESIGLAGGAGGAGRAAGYIVATNAAAILAAWVCFAVVRTMASRGFPVEH